MNLFTKFGIYVSLAVDIVDGGRLFTTDDVTGLESIYEINPTTYAEINSAVAKSSAPQGIGGIGGRLYHVDDGNDDEYELNLDTFATINNYDNSQISRPRGFGGIGETGILWLMDPLDDLMYEIDKDDLRINDSKAEPTEAASGIGGTWEQLFIVDTTTKDISELNTSTFAILQSATSYFSTVTDCGGTNLRFWVCGTSPDVVYEFSIINLEFLGQGSSISGSHRGIGGTKEG